MVIDSSAVIAIFKNEPEAEFFARAIQESPVCRISVANWMEVGIILDREGRGVPGREFDAFVARADIHLEEVSREQAQLARQAYLIYGKGRHPAGLNFGDCFSYALAKSLREPLLFKGEDFSKTDVLIYEE